MKKTKQFLEYLGGQRDEPVMGFTPSSLQTAAIWIVLLLIIYAFSGQSSKFIYIDF